MTFWPLTGFANVDCVQNCDHSASQTAVKPLCRLLQILIGHDVVAIKYIAGLVPANQHRNPLRDTTLNHVTDCGPSEVMRNLAGYTGFLTSSSPRSPEVLDHLAVTM